MGVMYMYASSCRISCRSATDTALHAVPSPTGDLMSDEDADALSGEHLVNPLRNAITSKMEDSGYEPSSVTSGATGTHQRYLVGGRESG